MAVRIPGGIEPRHLAEIREIMEKCLGDLYKFRVMQVNLRLNKSGTEDKFPYFIDWVAVQAVLDILKRDERELDPGLLRFGDDTPSEVNREALDGAPNTIINRDWTKGMAEKRPRSRVLAQKAGVMYQKIIGIIVEEENGSITKKRCVGTFTAGLVKKPDDLMEKQIDEELKEIATSPASPLVIWIKANLVLGGPFK